MNKILVFFMALAVLISMQACGGKEEDTSSEGNGGEASSEVIHSADENGKEEEESRNGTETEDSDSNQSQEEEEDEDVSAEEVPGVSELGDLSGYITLGTWEGINVPEKAEVTDELLLLKRQEMLASVAEQAEKSTAAELGDTVTMDYVGYVMETGEAFEGGEAEDAELQLGSGKFIDGFEDALVGHKAGESFDIFVTFPQDYHSEELAGVKARFAIVLKKVTETVYPSVDDELARDIGYDSAVAFEDAVMLAVEEDVYVTNLTAVWNAVLEDAEVKEYPKEQYAYNVAYYKDYYISTYSYYATMYGMELGKYLEVAYNMTEEEFYSKLEEDSKAYTEDSLKRELVAYSVADLAFNREVSQEEYQQRIQGYAEDRNVTVEELEEEFDKETLTENIIWDKVMEYLYENAVFGEVTQ